MFVGSEVDARARLERMTSAAVEPVLDASDLDDLLTDSKRADRSGLAPSDDGWEETWDLNSAAAEGWRIKKGRFAHKFSFSAEGRSFHVSDALKHFDEMIEHYQNKVVSSVRVSSRRRVVNPGVVP
jgi:hypothetical protein